MTSRLTTTLKTLATSIAWAAQQERHPVEFYGLLKAHYLNNGLYDELRSMLLEAGLGNEALRPLRNPAARCVEFYPAKLWPGTLPEALPIEADNEAILEPIQRVWTWSNWNARKQVAARWLALYGDLFIKVVQKQRGERTVGVYLQLLQPQHVTEFDTDERDFINYIRIDTPMTRAGGQMYTRTEVWDKVIDSCRVYEHTFSYETPIAQLGEPVESLSMVENIGIDFVPIVQAKFRDVGDERGVGAFTLSLDKIDEANRSATRLHRMVYRNNRNLWALQANGMDASGRPLPPPKIDNDAKNADGELEMGDSAVVRLPGNSSLQSLVPQLQYDAALAILQDHMGELERDMPELVYYRLREKGELSGRAIRLLLGDAIDRLLEARGNAETALIRAHEMALTLGTLGGLWNVGTYGAGDFTHTFTPRDPFPLTEYDKAQTMQVYRSAEVPLVTAAQHAGWTEQEIEELRAAKMQEQAEQATSLAMALAEQQRRFDQGPPGAVNVQNAMEGVRGQEVGTEAATAAGE